EVLTSGIDSGPTLILGFLAVLGLYYAKGSQWPRALKAEFSLCGLLAAAIATELGFAHPTFARYFLLIVPFLAIPAAAGLYAMASRLGQSGRPLWPLLLFSALMALGLGRTLYERRDFDQWSRYEELAEKINEVTPRRALLLAEEPVYFST